MEHSFDPRTWDEEIGRSDVQGHPQQTRSLSQPGLWETLSKQNFQTDWKNKTKQKLVSLDRLRHFPNLYQLNLSKYFLEMDKLTSLDWILGKGVGRDRYTHHLAMLPKLAVNSWVQVSYLSQPLKCCDCKDMAVCPAWWLFYYFYSMVWGSHLQMQSPAPITGDGALAYRCNIPSLLITPSKAVVLSLCVETPWGVG